MNKTLNDLLPGLIWAGGILVLALGASFARSRGIIDQDTTLRLVIGVNGLMIAHFGNRTPKAVAPSACAQRVARFSGWCSVLSGLVYAGLWIFAPIPVAVTLGTAVVAGSIVLTLGYCFRLRAQARAGKFDAA